MGKICNKCGKEFETTIRVGKYTRSLISRRFCLECSPYRGDKCRKLKCASCGKDFNARQEVNGKRMGLYNRGCCLDCVPFGSSSSVVFAKPPEKRKCALCGKEYLYDRKINNNRKKRCHSCCTTTRLKSRQEWCMNQKGGKCAICSYSRCKRSMDFHHLDPYKKGFNIGQNWSKSLDVLKAELEKCILVCSNCHGEIHEGLGNCSNKSTEF